MADLFYLNQFWVLTILSYVIF